MASMTDLSGMDVTTDARLVPLWDRVIRGILSHSAATGDDLNAVIAADGDFALAQAIRGLSCLMLGRAEMTQTAHEAMARARTAARRPRARRAMSRRWNFGCRAGPRPPPRGSSRSWTTIRATRWR